MDEKVISEKRRESCEWINVFFAKSISTHTFNAIFDAVCKTITEKILSDPNRPDILHSATIKPLNYGTSHPNFTEFVVTPGENNTTVSFFLHYQGDPSVCISATAGGAPLDLPCLFTISVKVELLLHLLVARVSLVFSNTEDDIKVNIGKDLITEIEVRPLLGDERNAQERFVESISSWLSNYINKTLRGQTFAIVSKK